MRLVRVRVKPPCKKGDILEPTVKEALVWAKQEAREKLTVRVALIPTIWTVLSKQSNFVAISSRRYFQSSS